MSRCLYVVYPANLPQPVEGVEVITNIEGTHKLVVLGHKTSKHMQLPEGVMCFTRDDRMNRQKVQEMKTLGFERFV